MGNKIRLYTIVALLLGALLMFWIIGAYNRLVALRNAIAAAREPKWHRYTPAGGLPELKEAIAVKTLRDSGYAVTAGQVLVTNGGKHAVYTAFAALCDPGDEVICPAPYWTTYPEAITLAGGSLLMPTKLQKVSR